MRRKAQAYNMGLTAVWGILVLLDFLGGFMQKNIVLMLKTLFVHLVEKQNRSANWPWPTGVYKPAAGEARETKLACRI